MFLENKGKKKEERIAESVFLSGCQIHGSGSALRMFPPTISTEQHQPRLHPHVAALWKTLTKQTLGTVLRPSLLRKLTAEQFKMALY